MAETTGKDGLIKIGANTVGETKGWTIDETVEVKDATAQRDTTRTKIAGFASFSGSIEANFDPDDVGQGAILLGSVISFEFYPNGETSGDPKWTGDALITKISHGINFDDVISISFDFESNGGALTKTTVV